MSGTADKKLRALAAPKSWFDRPTIAVFHRPRWWNLWGWLVAWRKYRKDRQVERYQRALRSAAKQRTRALRRWYQSLDHKTRGRVRYENPSAKRDRLARLRAERLTARLQELAG